MLPVADGFCCTTAFDEQPEMPCAYTKFGVPAHVVDDEYCAVDHPDAVHSVMSDEGAPEPDEFTPMQFEGELTDVPTGAPVQSLDAYDTDVT